MTAEGHIIEGFLSPGNAPDISVAEQLFADIYGCVCVLDRGYDADAFRAFLRQQNNTPVIPGRKNRKVPVVYDRQIYELRKRIEQLFGKIKENKRLSARYDKYDHTFMAFIALAFIKSII